MTEAQALIERLAKEAGLVPNGSNMLVPYETEKQRASDLAKFAELVAADCAKVANEFTLPAKTNLMASVGYSSKEVEISASTAERIDATIRARFGVKE